MENNFFYTFFHSFVMNSEKIIAETLLKKTRIPFDEKV